MWISFLPLVVSGFLDPFRTEFPFWIRVTRSDKIVMARNTIFSKIKKSQNSHDEYILTWNLTR